MEPMDSGGPWLPDDFTHPEWVSLGSDNHLRPTRADDVDIDYPAVMGSRHRLWSRYGDAWGWPPQTMTYAQDREDLARHAAEIAAHESFNYAVLNTHEIELYECVYIDSPEVANTDAEISWWVVNRKVGTELEAALDRFVPRWIQRDWPFARPAYTFMRTSLPDG